MDVFSCVLLLGSLLLAARGSELYRCPSKIPRNSYLKTYNGQCYQFVTTEKYWHAANGDCRKRGGHIVEIKNAGTQRFVLNSLKSLRWRTNGVWIGAHDLNRHQYWEWVTGGYLQYNAWDSGQPSCHFLCFEHCAQLRLDEGGRWHDYKCGGLSFHYSYVCQYDMLPKTTTSTTTTTTTTTTTITTTSTTTTEAKPNSTVIDIIIKPLKKSNLLQSANKLRTTTGRTTATSTSEIIVKYGVQGDQSGVQQQIVNESHDNSIGTGTLIGLVLAALLGIAVGVCLGAFIFIRRRKKEEKDDLPTVVFENPYYGEVTRPLTEGHEDSDDGIEKMTSAKVIDDYDENVPKNHYDIPPSMALSNPTYGTSVMTTGMEGAYDVVRTRKMTDYDCPPKPLPCAGGVTNWGPEPQVENLYESLENLKAALAEKSRPTSFVEKEEEERYVSMGNIVKQSKEA